jgi:CBS domain containing-hemolysin-like protein
MLIAISLFCIVCEAIFTALEVALGAVSRARLRTIIEAETALPDETPRDDLHSESGNNQARPAPRVSAERATAQRATRLLRLLERPDRLTLAFIIVTSLSLWTAGSLFTWQSRLDGWPNWVLPLVLVGVLFVAEVLPLLVAARNPEAIALRCVGLAEGSLKVLSPLIWLLGGIGQGIARAMGAGPHATPQVTEGELRTALREAEEEGVIESEERAMLEGAMDFRDKTVHEVMTPRIDVVGVPAMMPLPAVLDLAMREGHARLPVYESTLDRIVGIVAAKDLIPHLRNRDELAMLTARDVVRPPYFVPEHKRIAPTLEELRRQRTLMAIVVDADGGTAGLVTIEDLLEEIVGEIQDEYDQEEPTIRIIAEDNPPAAEPQTSVADSLMPTLPTIAMEAGVTVREVKRFWNRNFAEYLHLCDATGAEADDTLSMAALSLQLFDGVPQVGDRVHAGSASGVETPAVVRDSSAREAASRNDNRGAATSPANGPQIELEVTMMNGPRIEEVKLFKVLSEAA